MRLTVIGCSPAWPNPAGTHAGYLVEGPGRLLLDCGPGVLASLRTRERWPTIDAIVLSHLHLDHWGDLVAWAFGAKVGPGAGTQAPELVLPPGGREEIRRYADDLAGDSDLFETVFAVREYPGGAPFEAAGFQLSAHRVTHYGLDAFALRVSDGERVLAYSGDTCPCSGLIAAARDADLLLCEATLPDSGEGAVRGHLTLAEAQAAAAQAGARQLLVTHRPVELGGEGAELASDGLVVEL